MTWEDLSKELATSMSFQLFPKFFRDEIQDRLPACTPEQLEQVKKLIDYDRDNVNIFLEESKKFQVSLQKKIMGLDEILEQQQMMDDFDDKNASLTT